MLYRVLLAILALTAAASSRADDGAALIARHCLPCHGRAGAAPVKLESSEDLLRHRTLAAMLVEDGTMPPQIAAGGTHVASRALSAAEKASVLAALRDPTRLPPRKPAAAAPVDAGLAPVAAWRMPDSGGARIRTFTAPVEAQRIRGIRMGDPSSLATSPLRYIAFAPDPLRSLRRLEGSDGAAGFEAMGNAGRNPSGALGAVSRVAPAFELPAGFCLEVPGGDLAIETLCEPIGREADVHPRLAFIPASPGDSRVVRALALPVTSLLLEPGTCATKDAVAAAPRDIDLVAIVVKGGAFVRTVAIDAGEARVLEIADFRMAFNEPWVLKAPLRVRAGAALRARFGFDNTSGNPQQPSEPPREVEAGLPPFGEDAIAVLLYADAPASR